MKKRLFSSDEGVGTLFVCAFVLIQPLILHRGYFDVTETKCASFWLLSLVYLIAFGVLLARGRASFPPLDTAELCLLSFTLFSLLSTLLGGHALAGVVGADNRYQGMLTAVLTLGVTLALRKTPLTRAMGIAAAISFALVSLLTLIQHFGADPFGLTRELSAFSRGRYLSTLGNINFLGAYFVLFLPLWAVLYAQSGKKLPALLFSLGLCAAMCCRSESAVLGLCAALSLLPPLCAEGREELRRALLLYPLTALTMGLFALLDRALGGAGFSSLTEALISPLPLATLALFGSSLAFALRNAEAGKRKRFRRSWLLALAVLVLALLALLLLATLTPLGERLPAAAARWLVLDADWGTDRGAIWGACLRRYELLPLWQKLLGAGSGAVARFDRAARLFPDAVVDAAHNEYLHLLLTSGILGLSAWVGYLLCCFSRAFQSGGAYRALLLGAAAYAVQAGVNIAQPMTTPLFTLALALMLSSPGSEKRSLE